MIVRGREERRRGEEGNHRMVKGKEVGKRDWEGDKRKKGREGGRRERIGR